MSAYDRWKLSYPKEWDDEETEEVAPPDKTDDEGDPE